ncbi:hypothetical protein KDL01_04370 [Actinospica durhamensis]|uniref:Uncharacterized protein n=1 Tax=Actinospica durhamensis TaxID=1508375 RepID=A0A941EKD5_9ACTN|nr:hypothetical protein [Actinospica durhamensis]MBR7832478.1 hypothetical protein [Actinospica durhamensis]
MNSLSPSAGIWAGLSASGTSPTFSLPTAAVPGGQVAAACVVTGVSGTGTPTLQVFLDVSDASGNWWPVVSLNPQTAAGAQSAAGNLLQATPNAIGQYRLRWTISGTSPVFNVMAAAFGS